jgi:PD-(D/E)XK endonuclease
MEWLASKGALVWIPMGHSPNADLVAELNSRLLRVQVKTSTYKRITSDGEKRWAISLCTNGGNQSWAGITKQFDPNDVDYLFALVGDGRRWFIPATIVEGSRRINLGGTKYSEFEVERGQPIEHLVYSDAIPEFDRIEGECLSGQKDSTVNRAALPTQVRILPPPSQSSGSPFGGHNEIGAKARAKWSRAPSPKRQITIPKRPCAEAGLKIGDRMRARCDGPGRIVFERAEGAELLSPK